MLISRTAFSSATGATSGSTSGLALRLDEFQKTEQPLPLKLVELLRQIEKSFNVRAPLRAARTRSQPVGVMRFRQNLFEALRERRSAAPASASAKTVREILQILSRASSDFSAFRDLRTSARSIQRRPEMILLRRQPDFRQFVQRAADERRAQHRDARNVLQRIVEQLQQAQQIQNFAGCRKIRRARRPAARRPARIPSRKFPPCPTARAAAPPCRAIRRRERFSSRRPRFRGSGSATSFFNRQREQPRFLFRFVQIRQFIIAGFVFGTASRAARFEAQKQFRARRRNLLPR